MRKDKIKQALVKLKWIEIAEKDSSGSYLIPADDFAQEALTALDALHTYDPATHVAVPREPTGEMCIAGSKAVYGEPVSIMDANDMAIQYKACKDSQKNLKLFTYIV